MPAIIEVNLETGEQTERELTPDEIAALPNPSEPPQTDPKMTGIEFGGVMCSATREDQNGLVAVLVAFDLQKTAFQPTEFYFSNGNKLVLTAQNMQQFIGVWMPFRQSFFKPE